MSIDIKNALYKKAFDGADPKWRSAAIDADGSVSRFECKKIDLVAEEDRGHRWIVHSIYYLNYEEISDGWDGTDWKNLVIDRDNDIDGYEFTEIDNDINMSNGDLECDINQQEIPF